MRIFSENKKARLHSLIISVIASIYCFWLLYAANIGYLFISTIVYSIGIFFFYLARKEHRQHKDEPLFLNYEKWIAGVILILATISITLLLSHRIAL